MNEMNKSQDIIETLKEYKQDHIISLLNKSDEDKRKIESELSDLLMIDCDIDLFKITFEDIEKCESLTTKEFMLLEVLLDK